MTTAHAAAHGQPLRGYSELTEGELSAFLCSWDRAPYPERLENSLGDQDVDADL